mmetsp:Transcript_11512/g.33221  ORF Transcript_11512/g.33221 Transcript_11512/m.33221 type:complete len:297 (-) Transcript_11512:2448-3338(-)
MLRVLEVGFALEMLGQELVGLLQQLLTVLGHEAHHGIVFSLLLVHVDGEIRFVDLEEKLLCLSKLAGCLHALGLRDVQHSDLTVAHVRRGELVRPVPHAVLGVHLHRGLGCLRSDVVLLSLVKLACVFIVLGDALEVRPSRLRFQVLGKLGSLAPLAGLERSFDSLGGALGFDEVVDRHVDLFVRDKPIAPGLLQVSDLGWEVAPAQVHSLTVGMALDVRVQGLLQLVHFLVKFSGPVIKTSRGKGIGHALEHLHVGGRSVRQQALGFDELGGASGHPSFEVERDSSVHVALTLFQ